MIQSTDLTTTGNDILTVPVGKRYAPILITVCNNGTASQTYDMFAVKSGDSPSSTNRVLINRQLEGYDSYFITEKFLLEAGDKLRIAASTNGVLSATVSWAEF